MKYLPFITIIFLLVIKPVFSQFKILDDLKKTGDQILKEKDSEQKTNQNQKFSSPDTSKPVQNKVSSPKVQQEV
ncbi:MAG: hypothetical protein EXR14_05790 [Pelagibacteraceae bacterium]|nr:hypothetical protein [Pelagibacteraceae bacterium]